MFDICKFYAKFKLKSFFVFLRVLLLTCFMQNANIATSFGDLAQLVEHTAHLRDVNGSIPLVATSKIQGIVLWIFFV